MSLNRLSQFRGQVHIPLFVLTPDLAFERSGLLIIAGNGVTILGVSLCGLAGHLRDKKLGAGAGAIIGPKRSFAVGLVICILAGILSAMMNLGYAFGSGITVTAVELGATKDNAVNALWLLELAAGGLINVGYCVYLLLRNRSARMLIGQATAVDWISAWAMGLLWTSSVIFFGWGANNLGRLGASLGWSVFNAIILITTMLCGLLTHEWDGTRGWPLYLLYAGGAVLLVGTFILGMGA